MARANEKTLLVGNGRLTDTARTQTVDPQPRTGAEGSSLSRLSTILIRP